MKILFVDHAFHKRTQSTAFFVHELCKLGEITQVYFDTEHPNEELGRLHRETKWIDYDLVVVWQIEPLAMLPLTSGVPTLVCPMYDACGDQPPEHWALLEEAAILNFSYNLHVKTRDLVPAQRLVQYFPEASNFKQTEDFRGLRVFFWQRAPGELNVKDVIALLPNNVQRLHVHLANDTQGESPTIAEWSAPYPVTTSAWFNRRDEFELLLDGFNVLVCPRKFEGIGMVMLEALARGVCVIAHASPTHNEYIAHDINGVLFDSKDLKSADLTRAAEFGARGRLGVERGRLRWRQQMDGLGAFLTEVASKKPQPVYTSEQAFDLVSRYFNDSNRYYQRARDLYVKSKHAGSDPTKVTWLRWAINRLPGWSQMKAIIPLSVKQAAAAKLARLLR